MDTATRLQHLKDWQIKKQLKETAEQMAKEEHEAQVKADIKALWPRAKEMIDIYNACVDAKAPFPTEYNCGYQRNQFLAWELGGWIGFSKVGITQSNPYVNAVGMHSFKDYDINLSGQYIYTEGNQSHIKDRMEEFVSEFNAFEEKFYDWFDKFSQADPV